MSLIDNFENLMSETKLQLQYLIRYYDKMYVGFRNEVLLGIIREYEDGYLKKLALTLADHSKNNDFFIILEELLHKGTSSVSLMDGHYEFNAREESVYYPYTEKCLKEIIDKYNESVNIAESMLLSNVLSFSKSLLPFFSAFTEDGCGFLHSETKNDVKMFVPEIERLLKSIPSLDGFTSFVVEQIILQVKNNYHVNNYLEEDGRIVRGYDINSEEIKKGWERIRPLVLSDDYDPSNVTLATLEEEFSKRHPNINYEFNSAFGFATSGRGK